MYHTGAEEHACRGTNGEDARWTPVQSGVDPQLHNDFMQCSPCLRVLRTGLYLLQTDFENVLETSTGNLVWVKIYIIHAETFGDRHLSDTERMTKFKSSHYDKIHV